MIQKIIDFLIFFYTSKSKYRIHSPFVYQLIVNGLEVKLKEFKSTFKSAENFRQKLQLNNQLINIVDLGANGIKKKKQYTLKISEIAKKQAKPLYQIKTLIKLALYFKPQLIIEFGTSLGITSYHLASATAIPIITIEGNAETAQLASKYLSNFMHVTVINNSFDEWISNEIHQLSDNVLIFIDGNHQFNATIKYYDFFAQKATKNTILVFDDIYWNDEMKKAWQVIVEKNTNTVTIDLFYFGLVFFNLPTPKQHFKIFNTNLWE